MNDKIQSLINELRKECRKQDTELLLGAINFKTNEANITALCTAGGSAIILNEIVKYLEKELAYDKPCKCEECSAEREEERNSNIDELLKLFLRGDLR